MTGDLELAKAAGFTLTHLGGGLEGFMKECGSHYALLTDWDTSEEGAWFVGIYNNPDADGQPLAEPQEYPTLALALVAATAALGTLEVAK